MTARPSRTVPPPRYPADLIDRTETAATELLASVGDGAEPFGTASSRWLDLVV
jgi:hypothetical protein